MCIAELVGHLKVVKDWLCGCLVHWLTDVIGLTWFDLTWLDVIDVDLLLAWLFGWYSIPIVETTLVSCGSFPLEFCPDVLHGKRNLSLTIPDKCGHRIGGSRQLDIYWNATICLYLTFKTTMLSFVYQYNSTYCIYKYINRRLYFMYITSLKNLSCRHSLGCFRNSNSLTEECLSHRFGEPGTPRYRRSHHAVGSWHLCDETKYPSSGQAAITSSLGRLKSECTCGPHKRLDRMFLFRVFFQFPAASSICWEKTSSLTRNLFSV